MGAISTKVAGVTFKNSDGTNRQEILASIAQYDYLELRDSASEKYPEAIGVYDSLGRQVGNLPKSVAEEIRSKLESWQIAECVVVVDSVGSEDGKPLGCLITVSHDQLEDDVDSNQYEREIERLNAQIELTDSRYRRLEVEEKARKAGNSDGSGLFKGCTITLIVIGGIIGVVLYRLINGL